MGLISQLMAKLCSTGCQWVDPAVHAGRQWLGSVFSRLRGIFL